MVKLAPIADPREFGFDPDTVATALMPYEEFSSKPRRLILGIDMGVASIGLALIDVLNGEIVLMASHIFKQPVAGEKKTSAAVIRRGYRSSRRNITRAKNRKKAIRKVIITGSLAPADATADWFAKRFGEPENLDLRVAGLDRPLTDREFARVLYSFASHRGYIDQSKGDKSDPDDGKVKKALAANRKILDKNGYETYAQYLATQPRSRNKKEDYTFSIDLKANVHEVTKIFARQRDLGNAKATVSLEQDYLAALCWLTDTTKKDEKTYSKVGYCTYLGKPEKRAATSVISYELVRAYQTLSNVKIEHRGSAPTYIAPKMRNEIVADLFKVTGKPRPLKWSQLRRRLHMAETDTFAGRLKSDEAADCIKLPAWTALCAGLHESAPKLLSDLHDDIDFADKLCACLTFASSDSSLRHALSRLSADFTPAELGSLLDLPYKSKVFSGYGTSSLKALCMLRTAFESEDIATLYDAEEATGLYEARAALAAERNASTDGLLSPYTDFDPTCTNPTVLRATARLRRMVNSVIRHYGMPDMIRVELARELKHSAHEKRLINASKNKNEQINTKARQDLIDYYHLPSDAHIKTSDFRKVKLYNEQGGKDPYTGEGIDFARMLAESDYTEIDHILPISRSCDDSQSNKVLVLTKSNRDKSNRTPYEWMTSGEPSAPNFDEFSARMHLWAENCELKRLATSKLKKLLNKDFKDKTQDFIARQLNDTRYMSRAVAKWLAGCLPFPEDGHRHVFAVSGGATAMLRRAWDIAILDENGKKDRTDDRHHAIDAALIAACNLSIVMKVAKANETRQSDAEREALFMDSMPFPDFKQKVEDWIPCIVPTFYLPRNATGSLFNDSYYSYRGTDDRGKDLVKQKGEVRPKTTVWKDGNGTAKTYDGVYGLHAVFDETKGKSGRWLFDPVYYVDIPYLSKDRMRIFSKDRAIDYWEIEKIDSGASQFIIKMGDVLVEEGHVMRFYNYLVSSGSIYSYVNGAPHKTLQKTGPLSCETFPTPSKWSSELKVMQEDSLGLCWLRFLTARTESCVGALAPRI